MPTGSIIVVSYNSELCIETCLDALVHAQEWKVIVVDNGSKDRTVEKARRFEPNVAIFSNSENRGFAGAVNQGMRATDTDTCVILNPDAIASPGAVEKLAAALTHEGVGAAGGSLTRNGPPEKGFAIRRFPTLGSAVSEVLLLSRLWPGNPWNRWYRCLDLDFNLSQEVDQPAGACLAMKRKAWEELGGFDESFFPVWFEDVDFCRRLRDRNWKIWYCPEAVFLHSGGHSVHKLSFAKRQSYWYENQLRYFSKHHSGAEVTCLRAAIVAGLLLRSLLSFSGLRPHGISPYEAVSVYCQTAWRCGVRGQGLESKSKSTAVNSVT
jgi:N-acetylglucosaminyl-diphospho-decaprenol L-rhamnosyltransferase